MSTRENARPAILSIDHIFDKHSVDEHDEEIPPFSTAERVTLGESSQYVPWPSGILRFLDEGGNWKPYHRRGAMRYAVSGSDQVTIRSFIRGSFADPPSSHRVIDSLVRSQRTIDVNLPYADELIRYSCGIESPSHEDPLPSFNYVLWDPVSHTLFPPSSSSPSSSSSSSENTASSQYQGKITVEDVRGVEGGRPTSPCLLSGRWPVHRAYADRLIAGPLVGYLVFR